MQSYFANNLAAARTLAATLPSSMLASFNAASDADAAAWLLVCSGDIDKAFKYQGRRYNTDPIQQPNEFPRVAQESSGRLTTRWGLAVPLPPGPGDVVWDWDSVNNVAIVPPDVLLAVLYQANSAAAGTRDDRLDAQHDGVVYDQTGGLAESYKTSDRPGVDTGLCRRAYLLLRNYQLTGGRLI